MFTLLLLLLFELDVLFGMGVAFGTGLILIKGDGFSI